jgi:hypothetical protein
VNGVPTFRLAVAFSSLTPGLAPRLERAAALEPGAHWEIVISDDEFIPEHPLDAVVYGALAEQRAPRAFERFLREVARRGLEVARIPTSTPEAVDELPRRLRLSDVLELTPPAARRFWPPAQTSLPFDAVTGASKVWLPPRGPMVTLTRLERGVRLEANDRDRAVRMVHVHWHSSGVVVSSSVPGVACVGLPDWLAVQRDQRDALSEFADVVAGERGGPRLLLEPLVRRARLWLVRALPPAVRRVARLFHEEVRLEVAARLMNDSTGRLMQLARVCPGVFTLSSFRVFGEPLDTACDLAVRGLPLSEVLAALGSRGLPDRSRRSWVRHLPFVRRATPAVAPDALWLCYPPGIAIDDVPKDPALNAAWFAAVAAFVRSESHARLAPFVSAHGAELGALDDEVLSSLFWRLTVRGTRLGRWPSRKTTVACARDLVATWPAGSVTASLAAPRLAAPRDPRLEVRVLETDVDLAAEGEEMHHCIGTYAPRVARGETIALSVRFVGERLTAAVLPLRDGPLLIEHIAGFANRAPSEAALQALTMWLDGQTWGRT